MINEKIQPYPLLFENELRKRTTDSVKHYLALGTEERKRLEQEGVTIANFVVDSMLPVFDRIQCKKLLIVMDQGIGNMVMLTPGIKILKTRYPLLNITVLCKAPANQVIEGWEFVDKVITEFDDCYYDYAWLTVWSQDYLQKYSQVFPQYIKNKFEQGGVLKHEAVSSIEFADFLSGEYNALVTPHCQVASGKEAVEVETIIYDTLKALGKTDYIIFGDTTANNGFWDRKRWPYYVELAGILNKQLPNTAIFLIGDATDKERFSKEKWPENVSLNLCGSINIPQLAYALKGVKFYLGNDTGPSHIAAALGVKSWVIFGPTLLSKNKPIGDDVNIISKFMPCAPCQWTERWDACSGWECQKELEPSHVAELILGKKVKKKTCVLVGEFGEGAHRNELYIERMLRDTFKIKVYRVPYRAILRSNQDVLEGSLQIINEIVKYDPDLVLISGGQEFLGDTLGYLNKICPKAKVFNWYVDNRGQVEEWFARLSAFCDVSYWSTGSPDMLSRVFSKGQRHCQFLPITPCHKTFHPIDCEKDIDVLFVGVPHSKERIQLLEYLIDNGIMLKIYGNKSWNMDWPDKLKPYVNPGVFGTDLNRVLNRAKIVLNQNIINQVPLYFSDRYFFPMAVKTVGLNFRVPMIETLFEENKHMAFFQTKEECLEKILMILGNPELQKTISEQGHILYNDKYRLIDMLDVIVKEAFEN